MIDSTKAPVPAWKRYATMGLLVVLILVAGYVLYTKSLRHNTSGGGSGTAGAVAPAASPSTTTAPSTTIPGGIAVSSRNPFG